MNYILLLLKRKLRHKKGYLKHLRKEMHLANDDKKDKLSLTIDIQCVKISTLNEYIDVFNQAIEG